MDFELGGWTCFLMFAGAVFYVLYAIGSAAQAVGKKVAEAGQIVFEQNSEEITRGVVGGLWDTFFGGD